MEFSGISWVALGGLVLSRLVFALLRSSLFIGIASAFLRTDSAERRRVYRLPFGQGQQSSEVWAGAQILLFDALLLGTVGYFSLFHLVPATLANTLLSFSLLFVWLEIWFYATHRLLHTKTFYWIHKQHHVAKVVSPFTSLSFSLLERAILQVGGIGFVIVASRFVPFSLLGLGLYFLANYALNVAGHLNVECLPARFVDSWLGRVLFSSTFHAMHHARYQGNFGLFTQVLDRALGTSWEDYPRVFRQVVSGKGMARLGERIPGDSVAVPRA